jgi:hypothetical protein
MPHNLSKKTISWNLINRETIFHFFDIVFLATALIIEAPNVFLVPIKIGDESRR